MTQSIAVPCRLLAQFWGLGRSPGATRGRAVLLATVLVILTGCATGPRIPESIAPEPKVPTATWALVEQDILLASAAAKAETAAYAHRAVDQWMGRVRRYTEENYVHWYTSYWTQQWLAFKVALYQSDEAESDAVAVRKLARYLQDKYLSKVLEPASQEIDPSGILHQATVMYVRTLADKIKAIGQRYGLPEKAFRNRLNQISVISGEGALAPGTSLGHLKYNHDLGGLSAYAALMEQIELGGVDVNSKLAKGRLSPIARVVAETFIRKVAARGGSAAAAMMGGVAGFAISLGITGFGIAEHNKHKPELETQLKKILDPATEQMQRNLIQDSKNGVLGAVNHMSNQIKQAMQATAPEIHVFPYQRPSQQHHLYELPIGDPLYEDPW